MLGHLYNPQCSFHLSLTSLIKKKDKNTNIMNHSVPDPFSAGCAALAPRTNDKAKITNKYFYIIRLKE